MKESLVTEAVDHITKVESVLDFLSSEIKNNGLCEILTTCQTDLNRAIDLLKWDLLQDGKEFQEEGESI